MPAIGALAWLVFRSIDLTAAAEAVSLPPPGQNMMIAIVRCLPPFAPSAYDDVWKLSASCGVMASSLNQIATLRWSPYSDATQWVAVNFSPPIEPVAEHRVLTGAAETVPVAPDVEADAAALPGIGCPTFQALASAAARRRCSGVSDFAISFL